MISGIIKVKLRVSISRIQRLRLVTLTESLIFPDITKTEPNCSYCFLYIKEKKKKRLTHGCTEHSLLFSNDNSNYLTLLLKIMHCAHTIQIIH